MDFKTVLSFIALLLLVPIGIIQYLPEEKNDLECGFTEHFK